MDPKDLEHLPERVRRIRLFLAMSQADLAMTLKLHQTAVAKIETGQRQLSIAEAVTLAELAGVSLDDLIGPDPMTLSTKI